MFMVTLPLHKRGYYEKPNNCLSSPENVTKLGVPRGRDVEGFARSTVSWESFTYSYYRAGWFNHSETSREIKLVLRKT